MKILKDLSELQFYINLLEDINGKKKYNNYEILEKDLLIEFSIKVNREELNRLFEPTLEEDEKDLKLTYNNIL